MNNEFRVRDYNSYHSFSQSLPLSLSLSRLSLSLPLSLLLYQVERGNPESEAMLFSVPDFIGFACREVGELA